MEPEQPNLAERFLELVEQDNVLAMRELLNDQNISDVAELINEHPEYEGQIIMNMSVHRASSVFKILDLSQQKNHYTGITGAENGRAAERTTGR